MFLRICVLLVFITLSWKFDKATGSDVIAVFPKIFRPGSPYIVTCNLLKDGQKTVKLALARNGTTLLYNSSVVTYGKQNYVMINVPPSLTYSDITMAKISYDGRSIWSPVMFDPINCLIFIQTDRGMYAEKEEVKLRIVVLLQNLKPYTGKFSVNIFDGKGKTVQQWLNVHATKGVYSNRFTIPKDPNNGQWRIVVESMKRKSVKTFDVQNFVIPKFTVRIICPPFFTSSTKTLNCTVKARYFNGRAVAGIIHAQFLGAIRGHLQSLRDDFKEITGNFTNINSGPFVNPFEANQSIKVIAKVSDPTTGTTVVNSVVVKMKQTAVYWSLEPKRKYIHPGLPFVAFMEFLESKNSSRHMIIEVMEKKFKFCGTKKHVRTSITKIHKTIKINDQGIGKLTLKLSPYVSSLYINDRKSFSPETTISFVAAQKNGGLVVIPTKPFSVVGETSTFEILTRSRVTGPLWYIILTRGTNVKDGQCGQGTHSKFMCSIFIEPDFYPRFQLLFYHATKNGVIIKDSVFISVKGNPTNNFVSISVDKSGPYNPGEIVQFTVNSTENSVVYLLTIDEGIQKLKEGFDIHLYDVKSALTDVNQDQYLNLTGDELTPIDNSKDGYPNYCPGADGWKYKFPSLLGGFSDKNEMIWRPQTPVNRSIIINGEHVRRFFPRTWLWEEVQMGGRKSVSLTKKVPDTLTTWITTAFAVHNDKGLGMLQDNNKLKIQVFKPFFIKLKTPSNVIAGNSAVIQISVFNYNSIEKEVLIYVWFQDSTSSSVVKVAQDNSTLKLHAIDTKLLEFGFYNITIAAYDLQSGFKVLDSVDTPLFIKAPGVPQSYNIPKIISLNSGSWVEETVSITLPNFALTNTLFVYITITGDILAPSINGLGHLIRLPCGCGEQTMMNLAPNIYVIQYLNVTHQLSAEMRKKVVKNINIGIDSELRWRRQDGSFSVWGKKDSHGSTWLTSFVLACFNQADKFVPVRKDIFETGVRWLLQQQNSDGSFAEKGRVIQYKMQGGVRASRVSMTAYVLLTLLELKDVSNNEKSITTAKIKAMQYITRSSNINELRGNKHGMALTSYVLQKAGYSEKARHLFADLKRRANLHGQYLFWKNNGNQVYVKQKLSWQSPNPRARPVDIETSAYALLYLAEKKDMSNGMKIVNWLVSQRNPQGGFSSTQDTVVSLYALARFSCLLQQSSSDAEVKVNTDFEGKTVHVNRKNRLLVQRIELDNRTKRVEIKAKGKGFVLIDTTVEYNVMKSGDSTFVINTTISPSHQTFDKMTVKVCIRRNDNKDNGMVVAEVGLPCGFKADLSKTNATGLDHKETSSDTVVLYFKNLKKNPVCFDVSSNRVDKVTESQGVPIIVYDYYEPENYGIASYLTGKLQEMNICQICPGCNICKQIVLG